MQSFWSVVLHERRFVWRWYHLAALALPLGLAVPGVAHSMGVDARSLLIIGRAASPLPVLLLAPRLILDDVTAHTIELIATTRTGLARVFAARLTLLLVWAAALLALFVVPLELQLQSRYGLGAELTASLVDLLLFGAVSTAAAQRMHSETAGTVAGILFWVGGVLLGTQPGGAGVWLAGLTPFSAYLFGSVLQLWCNRLGWSLAALLLLAIQFRFLNRQSAALLHRSA